MHFAIVDMHSLKTRLSAAPAASINTNNLLGGKPNENENDFITVRKFLIPEWNRVRVSRRRRSPL
jgi:hypothetical protein